MAAQLRPNWMLTETGSLAPPPGLSAVGYVQQPIPASDQSVTVIRAWFSVTNDDADDPSTTIYTCWDAYDDGTNIVAGSRQIGDAYTVSVPSLTITDDPVFVPVFLQWVDVAQPQSGFYMIACDADDGTSPAPDDVLTMLYSVAP